MTITPYMPVYRRADVTMVRGEGVYLYDEQGKSYLDFASGIATNALGHGHPHVVSALKAQADKLWHCSNNVRNDQLLRFAERLIDVCQLDSAFFCSSGGEAVEAAVKFIRRYHYVQGTPARHRIITFENGFHGRSMTGISAGGNAIARTGFAPLLEGFDRVAFNDLEAVRAAIGEHTAGIMVEPIQGEGGVRVASPEFLQGLRALCDEHGLLLFFDEVQCGYGRCGSLFTHSLYGVVPDLVSVAKGIGNGFPLGACLAVEKVVKTLEPGCHGSTYGSNPLAMAVGNAVLDVMLEDGFFDHVQAMGSRLKAGLEALHQQFPDAISAVRGTGLLLGLELKSNARDMAERLRARGLLVAPAYGDVLRLVPPLIVTAGQVDAGLAFLEEQFVEDKG